eukprot:scaffold150098_cov45-Prasinocladus_malaysianus.AAC.2
MLLFLLWPESRQPACLKGDTLPVRSPGRNACAAERTLEAHEANFEVASLEQACLPLCTQCCKCCNWRRVCSSDYALLPRRYVQFASKCLRR